MSVRVCYLQRTRRGSAMTGLRLVGAGDESFWAGGIGSVRGASVDAAPGSARAGGLGGVLSGTPADYDTGAAWIKGQLQGPRSRDVLEAICLDAEGSLLSWVTTPGDDPALLAALARQGSSHSAANDPASPAGASMSGASAPSLVEFFAPDDAESSVQALAGEKGEDGARTTNGAGHDAKTGKRARSFKQRGGATTDAPARKRTPVLASADLPARLLVDALDREGVDVGSVQTIWHALAQAWDPAPVPEASHNTSRGASHDSSHASPVAAIVMIDPASSRLLWAWSRAGKLAAGGSARVRVLPADETRESPVPVCTSDDVARLASDWLAWSVQTGLAPARIIAVLPASMSASSEGLSPAAFGEAIARRCHGANVDAAGYEDPLGATLRRLATVLEKTPASPTPDAGAALVALSRRPGKNHRRLYTWAAGALGAASLALVVLGARFRASAERNTLLAAEWSQKWRTPVGEVFPDAINNVEPGFSALDILESEISKRQKSNQPAKAEAPMPIMQELDTLSFVLGSPDVEVDSLSLDSIAPPRITVFVPSTAKAEALAAAIQRVGGSAIEWSPTPTITDAGEKRKVTMQGRWIRPAGTAATSGGTR